MLAYPVTEREVLGALSDAIAHQIELDEQSGAIGDVRAEALRAAREIVVKAGDLLRRMEAKLDGEREPHKYLAPWGEAAELMKCCEWGH